MKTTVNGRLVKEGCEKVKKTMELTKNFNELEFYNEEVKNAIIECKKLGYDIYISNMHFLNIPQMITKYHILILKNPKI